VPHSHFPWPVRVLVPVAAVGLLSGSILLTHWWRSAHPRATPSTRTAATQPHPDAHHEARMGDVEHIPVAATRFDHARLVKLAEAKDTLGFTEMERRGRLFLVPSGTGILVIDRTPDLCEVRVLEGEHRGKSGWLHSECVMERNLTSPAR
jgi:hypothetical protein